MATMNDSIWENPDQFPAVRELDETKIELAAELAATQLILDEHSYIILEPGDGTRYELVIVATNTEHGPPFLFASSMGPLYAWMGGVTVHPRYSLSHYVANDNPWTATVYSLFLNAVGHALEAQPDAAPVICLKCRELTTRCLCDDGPYVI